MSQLPYARSFRELEVWKKARQLAREVHLESNSFPKQETYALTDQLRRAARSIGAQIAEAWAKRRYEKHFISKLTDADGEQLETQHWLIIAFDAGYLSQDRARALGGACTEIGAMLGEMILRAPDFCSSPNSPILREDPPFLEDPTEY